MSSPPTLFPGSGPVGLPSVPWIEKTTERSPFSSYMEATAAAEIWFDRQLSEFVFFGWLAKVSTG
jgi:hypothetical protein